jgi:hypothetical protein
MEIQAFKAVITETDLNGLVQKHLPEDLSLDDVNIQVGPDGITVKGKYQLFINVSFETLWEIGVQSGRLAARLASIRAMGIPGSIFKSAVLKLVGDAAKTEPWITIDKETILVDVDAMLLYNGLPAKTNLTRVICQAGTILLEGGPVPVV